MLKRSDVRNACFRAKVGDWRESQRDIQNQILSKLPPYANWDNFTKEWDITISKSGEIVIIKPEVDFDYVLKVCTEASVAKKNGLVENWNVREKNIIDIIEAEMLDGITTWQNFFDVWSVEIDLILKRIHIKLLKKELGQRKVEPSEYEPKTIVEMTPEVNEFKVEPMTQEEIEQFNKVMKSRRHK